MSEPPENPKIYHITHVRNIPLLAESRILWSDAKRLELAVDCEVVGMSSIKQQRLSRRPVKCNAGTMVGDYVPFYFCPRSVMLYLLHMGNHPELTYHEGQQPIVHLVADLRSVVEWASKGGRLWAFSDRNAATSYARFFNDLNELGQINWAAVGANDWRDLVTKDGKQAEFLVHHELPWELIERIGVYDAHVMSEVGAAVERGDHRPGVSIERGWYY
jgi:hypothetical protein